MRPTFIRFIVLLTGLAIASTYQINANSSGASSPKTGAPNETTCNSCHGGSSVVKSGTQHNRIRFKSNFTGGGYIPDSTYTITLTYAESSRSRFGFQMTSLVKGKPAGSFSSNGGRTGTFSSSVNGATRSYIEHTYTGSSGVSKDSTAWTFSWKAPSSNMGDITFYVALNSTNNNGSSSGDVIYNKTFSVSPSSLLPEATAKLSSKFLCAKDSITFEGKSTNSATSYLWSFPGGSPSLSMLQNPSIYYSTAGTKTAILQSKNSKGISKNDTLTFTVNDAAIQPKMNIRTNTYNLCFGDSVEFSIGTNRTHTYRWFNGETGKSIFVDTSTWVKVEATSSDGCKAMSDSVYVVAIPKPIFKVSYGYTDDSLCVGSNLLILLQDSGYTDSFSLIGANGPFGTASIRTQKIDTGLNEFQVWGKNSFGCITGPIGYRKYIGIDTPRGPKINILSVKSDEIIFAWDSIPYATEYEYSLDMGNSWSFPDTGRLHRIQRIVLDSATQTVDFWLRTATSNFCFSAQVSKTRAQGAGCDPIDFSLQLNKNIVCLDSTYRLQIQGLDLNRKLSIFLNGTITKDTIIDQIASSHKEWKVFVIDSSQLICGGIEKQIKVYIDTPRYVKTNLENNSRLEFCGVKDTLQFTYTIQDYVDSMTYFINTVEGKNVLTSMATQKAVLNTSDSLVWWASQTKYGCFASGDTVRIVSLLPLDAGFEHSYEIDHYLFSANLMDTISYEHYWFDAQTDTLLTNANTSMVKYYNPNSAELISVKHLVRYKFSKQITDTCEFISEKRNIALGNSIISSDEVFLFPNPIESLSQLKCLGCEKDDKIQIINYLGRLTLELSWNQIDQQQKDLISGVYFVEVRSINGALKLRKRLLVSE